MSDMVKTLEGGGAATAPGKGAKEKSTGQKLVGSKIPTGFVAFQNWNDRLLWRRSNTTPMKAR